jgi:Rrf2 family protein
MLRINRQTDYAIRVLLALAREPEGTRLSSASIGREMLIPKAFLTRIVAELAQAGLLTTFPGREGGLQLARPAEQLTLKDVVQTFEGPLLLSECMLGEDACPFEGACPVRSRWGRLQKAILDELERTTFADLALETIEMHGPVNVLPVQS